MDNETKKPTVKKSATKQVAKKDVEKKETKQVSAPEKTKQNLKEQTLFKEKSIEEIKQEADKSFKKKHRNKKIVWIMLLILLFLSAGIATPIIVVNANKPIDIIVKSSNSEMQKYKVEVKKGTKISKIKVVELDGYDFVGFFKDEACTKAYKSSDTLKKDSTIYASYTQKKTYSVNITGDTENYNVSANAIVNHGESYTLTVSPKAGYYMEGLIVKVDGEEVILTSGTHIITNITQDVNIEFIEKKYNINITGDVENYILTCEEVVCYGQACTLNITAKEGFDISFLTVKVNGQTVTLTNGSYTVANITEDVNIELIANNQMLSVVIGDGIKQVGFMPNTTIKNIVENIESLEYETSGTIYTDEACTQEADLNQMIAADTILYTKAATLDKLVFYWDSTTLSWQVERKSKNITGELVIPFSYTNGTYDGNVTTIRTAAFGSCAELNEIVLPNSITTIGHSAFANCNGLKTVTIPSSVEKLDVLVFQQCKNLEIVNIYNSILSDYMFRGCEQLKNVNIYNNLNVIGSVVFEDCNKLSSVQINSNIIGEKLFNNCIGLTTVTVGENVTTINQLAFGGCVSLTSITIPKNVVMVSSKAFNGCSGLTSITVEEGNSVYHSSGNCIIETESKTLIVGCKTSVIPTNGSVTKIGDYAFAECSTLTTINIPNSVVTIGKSAFLNCIALMAVDIPKSVITIEYGAFRYCAQLTELTIPSNVKELGNYAFYICKGLTSVIIENGVTEIGEYLFSGCDNLIDIVIPDSVTKIGMRAFSGCDALTSVTLGSGLTFVSAMVFKDCNNLQSMVINSQDTVRDISSLTSDNTTYIIYIKNELNSNLSVYLTTYYTQQATSDKDGYDKWVKN